MGPINKKMSNFIGCIIPRNHRIPAFFYTKGINKTILNCEFFGIGIPEDFIHEILKKIEISLSDFDKNPSKFFELLKSHFEFKSRFDIIDVDLNHYFFQSIISDFENIDFKFIQIVWANRLNQFPEEWPDNGGIPKYVQPLFSKKNDFGYFEEKNEAVYTTQSWRENQEELNCVIHDFDGSWQFLPSDFNDGNPNEILVVSIESIIKFDFSLNECFDLNLGEYAERKNKSEKWERKKLN